MCCGNKGGAHTSNNGAAQTMKASSNGRNTMSDTLGHTGMTLLEYLPVTSGTRTFTGALTRHTYVFGGKRKQGYVDTRDASNFLTLRDNTLPLFREIVVSPVKLQHTEPPPPVTPEPNQTAITQAAAPPDTTHPAKKMTVKKSL